MVAVIFEVLPKQGQWEKYFDLAALLGRELDKTEGFISIERFQSLNDPKKLLSLSFWKDEESVALWRNEALHRHAQKKGRNLIFDEYRLRVAHVARDYGMHHRNEAPADSKNIHQ